MADEVQAEAEQSRLAEAKYGGIEKKHPLIARDHQYFDSADWALNKGEGKPGASTPPPRTEPPRRSPRQQSSRLCRAV